MGKIVNNSTLVFAFPSKIGKYFRSNATLLGIRKGVLQGIVLIDTNVLGQRRFSSKTGVSKELSRLKQAFRDVDSALVLSIKAKV